MAASALIVKVPEAEAVVSPLRARFDAASQLGVPAHITILFPFMDPGRVSPAVLKRLQQVLAAVPSFSYSLTSAGSFETTAYLAPSPPDPFISLTTAVVRCFPEFPPYGELHARTVPHLTVAHGDANNASIAATELAARLRAHPPIHATCDAVTMLENASGQWREMHTFRLLD